jgi:hypothetical protein
METIDATKFMLVSKASGGECLQQIKEGRDGDKWDAYQSRSCNTEEINQQIQLIQSDGSYSFKTGDDNYMVMTGDSNWDDVRALWESDRSGKYWNGSVFVDQHGWFNIIGTGKNGGKTGVDALVNGPIKIQSGWKDYKRFHMEDADGWKGERLRAFTNADSGPSDEAQTFLHYALWKKCSDRQISLDDCTKTKLQDCSDTRNHNITDCPKEYCSKSENVSKEECRTICTTNRGLCDAAAQSYCNTEEGKSTDFCSCFGPFPESTIKTQLENKGYTVRRICNLSKCSTDGYKTRDMLEQACPSLQICIQGVETGQIGGSAAFKNVDFSCIQNSNTENSQNSQAPEDTSTEDDIDEKGDVDKSIPPLYFVIGGIVLLLVIIFFLIR